MDEQTSYLPRSDRVVYITGASAGIGEELARQLAAPGARLALFARRLDRLTVLAAELEAKGATVAALAADVADRDSLRQAFAAAEARLGPADLLIANAGIGYPVQATAFAAARIEEIFATNYFGVIYAIEAVLPTMLARRSGQIVGISSLAASRAYPEAHVYCASKSAVSAQLEGLRLELAPHGIHVTTICPGFVRTFLTASNKSAQPLILSCEVAARRILRAVERRAKVYHFPRRLYALALLSRLLPDWLMLKLFLLATPQRAPVSRAQ